MRRSRRSPNRIRRLRHSSRIARTKAPRGRWHSARGWATRRGHGPCLARSAEHSHGVVSPTHPARRRLWGRPCSSWGASPAPDATFAGTRARGATASSSARSSLQRRDRHDRRRRRSGPRTPRHRSSHRPPIALPGLPRRLGGHQAVWGGKKGRFHCVPPRSSALKCAMVGTGRPEKRPGRGPRGRAMTKSVRLRRLRSEVLGDLVARMIEAGRDSARSDAGPVAE